MTYRLTPEQKLFAEKNYGLLCKFARDRNLSEDELSFITERYLKTVKRYLSEKQLQKYSFSTVLYYSLRSELSHLKRKKEVQTRPLDSIQNRYAVYDEYWLSIHQVEHHITIPQMIALKMRLSGMSNKEIAMICGISIKAVESRFYRLRKRLHLYQMA